MSTYRKIKPKSEKALREEAPSKPIYPSFSIELKHLPEAKKWDIGKTYHIGLEVEMTGLSIHDDYSNASFDIKGIRIDSEGRLSKVQDKIKQMKKHS